MLCEGLWGRDFLTAYNSANDGERLRMAEGLGKSAGLALLAVPMVEAFNDSKLIHSWGVCLKGGCVRRNQRRETFTFTQAQF